MATPKQLNLSSAGGDSEDEENSSSSTDFLLLPRRKSLRTPSSKRHASNGATVTAAEPVTRWIWNEDDELAILKGLLDYRSKTGLHPDSNWDEFFCFVRGSIHLNATKEQLLSKIKKLKKIFLVNMEKIGKGNDPLFTRSSDSEAFGFSMMIWGRNDAEFGNGSIGEAQSKENDEDASKADEEVPNAEALNENEVTKAYFDDKSNPEIVVDKIIENEIVEKESHYNDGDDLCALHDAFETMLSKGLSDYQKKKYHEKLMNLGAGKRKELSYEWKAIYVEEVKLNIKKLRFSAKLAEVVNSR